jgi:hypothetical protein
MCLGERLRRCLVSVRKGKEGRVDWGRSTEFALRGPVGTDHPAWGGLVDGY